jgi:phenylalanyl-tRNA synthetase beta chain
LYVSGLAYGPVDELQWGREDRVVDFFDVKGDVETLLAPLQARFEPGEHPALHPGRCARVVVDGRVVGHVGELHPRWRQRYELPLAPVVFELEAEALLQRPLPVYRPISRQQPVWRDIAVIVREGVTHDALLQAIMQAPTDGLVRQAVLFDVYRPKTPTPEIGPGQRSLALRLELLDDRGGLTDERIDAAVRAVVDTLSQRFGARLRA